MNAISNQHVSTALNKNLYAPNQFATATQVIEARSSEIPDHISNLHSCLEQLEAVAATLEERLSSVLSPFQPLPTTDEKVCSSKMGQDLQGLRSKVYVVQNRLTQIVHSLQL